MPRRPAHQDNPLFEQPYKFSELPWAREAIEHARRIYGSAIVYPGVRTFDHAMRSAETAYEYAYPNPIEAEHADPENLAWVQRVVLAALYHELPPESIREEIRDPEIAKILHEVHLLRGIRETASINPRALNRLVRGMNPTTAAAYLVRMTSVQHALNEGRNPEYMQNLATWSKRVYVPVAESLGLGMLAQELRESSAYHLLNQGHEEGNFPGLDADASQTHYLETLEQFDELTKPHGNTPPALETAYNRVTNQLHDILREAGIAAEVRDANNKFVRTLGAPVARAKGHATVYLRVKGIMSLAEKVLKYAQEGKPHAVRDMPDLLSARVVLHSHRTTRGFVPATHSDVVNLLNQHLVPSILRQHAEDPAAAIEVEAYMPAGKNLPVKPPKRLAGILKTGDDGRPAYAVKGPKASGYTSLHSILHRSDPGPDDIPGVELHLVTLEDHLRNQYGPAAHWSYKGGELSDAARQELDGIRKSLLKTRGIQEELELAEVYLHRHDGSVQTIHVPLTITRGKGNPRPTTVFDALTYKTEPLDPNTVILAAPRLRARNPQLIDPLLTPVRNGWHYHEKRMTPR